MTIVQITVNEASTVDWIPQIVYRRPIGFFSHPNLVHYSDCDDLDEFTGVEFCLDGITVSIRQYKGFPADHTSVYFARRYDDHEDLALMHAKLCDVFGLTIEDLFWARWYDEP